MLTQQTKIKYPSLFLHHPVFAFLDTGLYCNQTFDNLVCWPDTKAGTVAEQNCPNYINNFNTRGE